MATAYAPLSNGGYRVQPLAITRVVKPNGHEDIFAPVRRRAFSDGVAYEVARILQNNVTGGTGVGAQIGVPVGGKTGTTDDYADAWFVGFTPNYSTAVWMGYPNNDGVRRSMYDVHGVTVAGGTFPASIWADFMRVVVARDGGSGSFPLPNNPVSWSPFSSDFTRAAGRRSRPPTAKSTGSTDTTTTTKAPTTVAPQSPKPTTQRPRSAAVDPTPAPPAVPATPTPAPGARAPRPPLPRPRRRRRPRPPRRPPKLKAPRRGYPRG